MTATETIRHHSPAAYADLPAGTYLINVHGTRIRILDMRGTMAHCEKVKRDGTRDARTCGWSGSLLISQWHIAIPGDLDSRAAVLRP